MKTFQQYLEQEGHITGVTGATQGYINRAANQFGQRNFNINSLYNLLVQNVKNISQGQKQANIGMIMARLLKRVANEVATGKIPLE